MQPEDAATPFDLALASRTVAARSQASIAASRFLVRASREILSGVQWRHPRLRGGSASPGDENGSGNLHARIAGLADNLRRSEQGRDM